MKEFAPVRIDYFSDILCVWAYVSQVRLDECSTRFAGRIALHEHFIPVFGDVPGKMAASWESRGGVAAYAAHVREVAARFPHVEVSERAWVENTPQSSAPAHLLVKAAQLLESDDGAQCPPSPELAWALRLAFFRDARDVSARGVLLDVAGAAGFDPAALAARLDSGEAMAALCADAELQSKHLIQGSPTLLLNEGRQKLYGNVGYRVIQANVEELIARPGDVASWC
ncbi:MAG: DsbA family protein [Chrysiogenetes bacterium]|nr:DsbA family protein [Chrysiogenetes bacterium]